MVENSFINSDELYLASKAQKHINEIITKLNLSLKGQHVLTEAGSAHFIYTPLISYYAGADKTFVWIKDSVYGKATDIEKRFYTIIDLLSIDRSRFELAINDRPISHVSEATIVTNLGSVRPLNQDFLSRLKKGAVISYMCESWELRNIDVDIDECKLLNIPIAGVWENHPDLLIFDGCGPLSVKLCLEAGLEVYQNKILIVSEDKFGKVALDAFSKFGASFVNIILPSELKEYDFKSYDFIFIADYSTDIEIIGQSLISQIEDFKKVKIVHLCGSVDFDFLKENGIACFPKQNGYPRRMSKTLAHLGIKPLIDLHAAGLKVGESLYKGISNPLVQII